MLGLIERFSEDIDIAVDRDLLGFGGELSRTQVSDKLRRAACTFVRETLQKERAAILFEFEQYPDLKEGYNLVHSLRMIYAKSYETALPKLALWYNKITESGFKEFPSVAETIQVNYPDILNFFNNRATNASAESFNYKPYSD